MRDLVLLRGIPGSGKSTWTKQMGLEPFTLSSDDIRLMYRAPQATFTGRTISGEDNKKVWATLHSMLEHRMENGDTAIVDATHTNPANFDTYIRLAKKYRYKIYVLTFDIPLNKAKAWNRMRDTYKWVPEEVLEKMHTELNKPLPKIVTKIDFDQFNALFAPLVFDVTKTYRNVNFIGDIQGCYEPLKGWFDKKGLRPDELYIFTGDLIDRGIQNDKVVEFMLSICKMPNVKMVWGNHEQWLWHWAIGDGFLPNEFVNNTQPQLEEAGISKELVKEMLELFDDVIWLKHHDDFILVTHAGVSHLETNFRYMSAKQFIKGVGPYNTEIDTMFSDNLTDDAKNVFQVHGHRNAQKFPIKASSNSFNLEGEVEFGGHLRMLIHNAQGFTPVQIKNDVYNKFRKPRAARKPKK